MKTILNQMLEMYPLNNEKEKLNALKEVVQEVVLCGLSRGNFFAHAAFYGGTALRIFHDLDRFSENLDFSLLEPDLNFNLKKYFSYIKDELNSVGLYFQIEEKIKTKETNIKSAFIKGNIKEHILCFFLENDLLFKIDPNKTIKIKIEVDVNPPSQATYEFKQGLMPSPYHVRLYDMPSLFAGKVHALICRSWKNRIKGRDLYDYIFYLSRKTPLNLTHLKARLVASSYIDENYDLNRNSLISILNNRFLSIDYEQVKKDVEPFVKDPSKLDIWSYDFFKNITENIKIREFEPLS